jgi:hypothetical protein
MNRLPTSDNCPECGTQQRDPEGVSVFYRLGPTPLRLEQGGSSQREDLSEEEDRYHRPRWCPDGLNRSQKRRVQ